METVEFLEQLAVISNIDEFQKLLSLQTQSIKNAYEKNSALLLKKTISNQTFFANEEEVARI